MQPTLNTPGIDERRGEPALRSAVYVGWVRHRRFGPVSRDFTFPLFMLYLDLDETERVFATGRMWATDRRRRGLPIGRFRRGDYLGDASVDLRTAVLDRVERDLGFRPTGAVRLLTHARQYGYVFNPVSFYYCFDRAEQLNGERLVAIVAEITNTPWKERHAYVLECRSGDTTSVAPTGSTACGSMRPRRFSFEKVFHVSPFLPMGLGYEWSFSTPCPRDRSRLGVHMTLRETEASGGVQGPGTTGTPGRRVFDATLRLDRREIGPGTLDRMLLRFPLLTARVVLLIHWHALLLWLRRVPVFAHPARHRASDSPAQSGRRNGSPVNPSVVSESK